MFNFRTVVNTKNEVVQATIAYNTAYQNWTKALGTRGMSVKPFKAPLHRAEDRLIRLQNKLHEVCGHDAELIALIAQEINEEVAQA
jgi:hypothetical protein